MNQMKIQKLFHIRQQFDRPCLNNIPAVIKQELSGLNISSVINKGDRIVITAGSRGISNICLIIRSVVEELKALGADPFIVPAMGSHGGATAEGQLLMLKELGITEESVGAPIISCIDVVQVGMTKEGIPVWLDRQAANASGIVVLNRIKLHTEFNGEIESGLMKMISIGLGKHHGAYTAHQHILKNGYRTVIPSIARTVLANCPVIFGLGIVENAYHETAIIKGVLPKQFEEEEKMLLKKAKVLFAKLPFDKIDVLIISEMGKQIAGTGMDTNVIGRIYGALEPEPESPVITRICILDITEETHGNAIGIGLADFTTKKLVDKIDYKSTYINGITSFAVEKVKIPMTLETEQEAVSSALRTCGVIDEKLVRLVWIKNTLELEDIYVSEGFLPEVRENSSLEIVSGPLDMSFDDDGNLYNLFK